MDISNDKKLSHARVRGSAPLLPILDYACCFVQTDWLFRRKFVRCNSYSALTSVETSQDGHELNTVRWLPLGI
jgi:hypothetical protein